MKFLTKIYKGEKRKCFPSAVKRFFVFFLIILFLLNVGAACLYPQVVYASFAGTMAGYILTLFASFNTAITNPEVVTAINNTFGSMALEATMDAAAIDQGIASIAASTGFDMATIFSNTVAEAEQFIASAPPGSLPAGAAGASATAGANLAAGGAAMAEAGTGTILTAIGGTVLPLTAAVAAGVAGGILINHIRQKISDFIKTGASLNQNVDIFLSIPSGSCVVGLIGQDGNLVIDGNMACVAYKNGSSSYNICFKLFDTKGYNFYYLNQNNNLSFMGGSSTSTINQISTFGPFYNQPDLTLFNSDSDARNYLENINKSNLNFPIPNLSPDIIGLNGNQTGYEDNGQYVTPNIYPVYNYGDTIINYINPTDYQTFVQNANQNTADGETSQDVQGTDFSNFINPYIQTIQSTPDTDPEQNQPTVPYPDPEQVSPANPVISPIPETDIAPTSVPYPEPETPTEQETTDTNNKILPFDLSEKFPFCIPFDIAKVMKLFEGGRAAPYFEIDIPFGDAGTHTLVVDLREWDSIAALLRTLELLLFIVLLAVGSRNLLGGNT